MDTCAQKLNFLDMQNYLAPGTSLRQFYQSQQVTTPKGHFPYRVFDTLSCLDWTALPKRSDKLKHLMTRFNETDPSEIIIRQQIDEILMMMVEPEPKSEKLSPDQERLLNIKLKKVENVRQNYSITSKEIQSLDFICKNKIFH